MDHVVENVVNKNMMAFFLFPSNISFQDCDVNKLVYWNEASIYRINGQSIIKVHENDTLDYWLLPNTDDNRKYFGILIHPMK